jgi:hypothetical protein
MDPVMAFPVRARVQPGIEVVVNFGVFAGREATSAEIDRLAEWLVDEVGEVSIISEERHQMDGRVEASVHQVRIEVSTDRVPLDRDERAVLEDRVVERAEHWARLCVAERHADVAEI